MQLIYNLLLLVITFGGGSIALFVKRVDDNKMHYLLALSGSFLLSITFLHLLPESFEDHGSKAGLLLLGGFFLQLIIQRLTHGIEHGHVHTANENHHHDHFPLASVLLGLIIHASMEGLPLGLKYNDPSTSSALYIAVAAHKMPEAILATSLVMHSKGMKQAIIFLLCFSFITPLASMLASAGSRYYTTAQTVSILLPVVAGAFIHIATTIFFESGTKQHKLSWQKVMAITIGLAAGLLTILFE